MLRRIDIAGRFVRRWRSCRSGMATAEFALVAPVLILLFFGVVESADGLARSRQVDLAVNTLADLASQETKLLTSDADDLFGGVRQIVDDADAPMSIRLVSVINDPEGDPVVHWSRDNEGGEPYAKGAAYNALPTATLIDPGSSILVAEISYSYSSAISKMVIPPINFESTASRWPRRSVRVQLCTTPASCTS
ncbi:TadE/TadG family type IV pilus assembly protein [Hyphococcus sp.]|uniref:TadE/TadG family type IV pilus assembly protein n=1 Tax=Hyphococcus sp. TaxID=2038636 RepID=UPI0035C78604